MAVMDSNLVKKEVYERVNNNFVMDFRELVENANDIIQSVDENGNILYVNNRWKESLGYSEGDLKGLNLKDIIQKECMSKCMEIFEKVKKGNPIENVEIVFVTKKGEDIFVEGNVRPIKTESGFITVGIFRDITQRKNIEKKLEFERQQLISIFDAIDEPVYVSDIETHEVLYSNEALKKQFGDVRGKKCYEVFQGLDSPCPFCTNDIIKEMGGKEAYIWEFQNLLNKRWYRCIDKAIRWPDGRLVRYELAIDITDRKKAEETMKYFIDDLESENKILRDDLEGLMNRIDLLCAGFSSDFNSIENLSEVSGGIYLFPIEYQDSAYNLFSQAIDAKMPALAVIRSSPNRFETALGRKVEVIWLTTNRVDGVVCVDPNDFVNLSIAISEFFKHAPEGLLLFEGIELLMSNVEFSRILRLIQILNDKVSVVSGSILMILDYNVVGEKELKLIKRECLPMPDVFKESDRQNGKIIAKTDLEV